MSHSIVLGFVIYNSEESFLLRIQAAIKYGFNIYIYDNSPNQDAVRKFCNDKKEIKYYTSGRNVGLGLGISSICAQAFYENNSALIFFDQDSVFNKDTLNFIEEFHSSHPALEVSHSIVLFSSKGSGLQRDENVFKNVSLAINSGSLFYLRNLSEIGWHNYKYFVDCVDYEFCLRSKIAGFKIGEYSLTPGFDHSLEQADKVYRVFGRKYSMRAYPLFRMKDTTKSSIKLILFAAVTRNFKFSTNIARLLFIYIATQMIVRVLNLMDEKKEN